VGVVGDGVNIEAQSAALRRLAAHLVHDADDLVQDAWVDALRNPPSDDRSREPWLRRVLRNRSITNYRAAQRRRKREEQAAAAEPPASAEQLQVARELLGHLSALPAADRDLLTMRYWEGCTLHECAERLKISPSTARSRHARALSKLRARLDERTGGREAWLGALAPWVRTPAPAVSFASLSVGGVVASTLLWLVASFDPGCGVESSTHSPERPVTSITSPQTSEPTRKAVVARKRWREHLAAIKVAQAERRTKAPESEACGSPLPNSETSKRLRPVIARLREDLAACRHLLPDEPVSKMQFDAIVLGDPEVGSVIESIEPTDSDEAHADFAECFAESIYTIELPTPSRCARDSYGFVLNLDIGSVGVRLDRRNRVEDPEEIEPDEAPHPEGSQAPDVVLEIATVLERKGQNAAVEMLRERGFTRGQDGKWVSPDGEVEIVVSVEDCNGSACDESP